MATLPESLGKEKPMDSALNSAHFCNRRAENHLKYGRYDDAIRNHEKAVTFLTKAIAQSTIPTNIEYLEQQRKYHENIQQIIGRQKREFEHFLLLNGLKLVKKPIQIVEDNQKVFYKNNADRPIADVCQLQENVCDDKEFFSFASEFKNDQSNSDNAMHQATFNEKHVKDNSDDCEFFSLVSELKIDQNSSINGMDQTCVNENGDSDSGEYFSLL